MFERIWGLKKRPFFKKLGYLLKITLTIAIFWLVFRKIEPNELRANLAKLSYQLALVLMGISALRHYLQYNNWFFSLKINEGMQFDKRQVLSSYLIGQPLRFAIPGGSASFAKVLYVQNSSIAASLIATTLERFFLTWGTWGFASIAGFYYLKESSLALRLPLLLVPFMPFFLALILSWIPKSREYASAYLRYAPFMMVLQILNSLLMYLQYYLILGTIGTITFSDTCIGMGLTNLANSIPITISGLGLREEFAIHFLADFGFVAAEAVAATLTLFFFHDFIIALIGAMLMPFQKRKI